MIYLLGILTVGGVVAFVTALGHIARQERLRRVRVLGRIAGRPFTPRRFYRLEPTKDGYWAQFVDRDRPTYDLDAFVDGRATELAEAAFHGRVARGGQYVQARLPKHPPVYVQLTPLLRTHFAQLQRYGESPRDWLV